MGRNEDGSPYPEMVAVDADPERSSEDESMERLLKFAGPRPGVPQHVLAEVKRVTHPAWQDKVQHHRSGQRRRNQWTLLAAAAMILMALGLILWRQASFRGPLIGSLPAVVATIELLHEAVDVRRPAGVGGSSGTDGLEAAEGSELTAGSIIETGAEGRARLRLASGASLRLDVDSSLRVDSATEILLERGAVYLDTDFQPNGAAGTQLQVKTPFGIARDIGTQFEVRLLDEAMRVLVREGEVAVNVDDTSHSAPAGSSLTIHRDGTAERESLSPHAEPWQWVLETSPVFDLEGRTLSEFLTWVTRETGLQVRYSDPALESEAAEIKVHGSLVGVRPDLAPKMVLPSSGLTFRVENGVMVVGQS